VATLLCMRLSTFYNSQSIWLKVRGRIEGEEKEAEADFVLGSCVGHVDIVVAAEVRCVQRRARLVLGIRIRRGRRPYGG